MNKSIYRKSLDLQKQGVQFVIKATRNDTLSRQIILSIVDGGKPFDLTNATAVFYAQKPSGNILYNNCKIVDNAIIYDFTEQTLVESGVVTAHIKLYGATEDGKYQLLSVPRFVIEIEEDINDDEAVESTNEYTALTVATAEASAATLDAVKVVERIETALTNGEFNGKDGFSPTIEVMSVVDVVNDKPVETGVNLNITDINGTQKVAIPYGKDYVLTDTDKQEIAEMVDVKAGGESWRKLFELTTTQATAMVEQTTDDNGDVFKLKKAIIKIDFPAVSRGCAECTIDLHPADEENEIYYSLYMDNNAMANQEPYTNIASVNTKPFVNSELVEYKSASISIDDNTSNGAFSIATRILRPIPYLDYVDYFALYDLGGKNIPSGTKITMWGVDDD